MRCVLLVLVRCVLLVLVRCVLLEVCVVLVFCVFW